MRVITRLLVLSSILHTCSAFLHLPNKFYHEATVVDTGSFDHPMLAGRGMLTAVLSRYTNPDTPAFYPLFVFHRVYVDNAMQWTETARLQPNDVVVADFFLGQKRRKEFGNSAIFKTTQSGNVIMANAYEKAIDVKTDGVISTVTGAGAVYVFTGEWSKWSQQQRITLDNNAKTNDRFGIGLAMNRKHLGDAAIGCGDCDPLGEWDIQHSGAVYHYTAQPPLYNRWTQQQVLFERNYFFNKTGSFVALHNNTLVAAASSTFFLYGGATKTGYWFMDQLLVYSRPGPASRWTFAQKLDGAYYDTRGVSLHAWDDAIFVGNCNGVLRPGASPGPTARPRFTDGHVKVYYPNLPAFKSRSSRKLDSVEVEEPVYVVNDTWTTYTWTAPQWSLAQVLYLPGYDPKLASTTALQAAFGLFDIWEDTMVVTTNRNQDVATANMYVYEREYAGGQWSVQQIMQTPDATANAQFPPSVYHNVISYTQEYSNLPNHFFSTDAVWDCLVVSMEDQFGDGWDTAKLRVEAPDGSDDLYYPSCDSTNALRFRYCPLSEKDAGLYKFSIVGAEKAKYYWEIQWRVFEEKTGQWFMGRHDTKMDFHWDGSDKAFSHRAMAHDIPTNITCKECKPRPPEKAPKRRELKGSQTHHPTISPAPTLSQTDMVLEHWEWFVMTTTPGLHWFDEQHKGTNYYISDAKGHRLISTGTLCPWEGSTKSCWQSLSDGDYTLRVSGDLDSDRDSHTWEFCGRTGGAREMMTFRVTNGQCDALLGYVTGSAGGFCERELHTVSFSAYELILLGLHTSDLSQDAPSVLKQTLHTLFPAVAQSGVRVDSVSDAESGVRVELSIQFEVRDLGFNYEEADSVAQAYEAFSTSFQQAIDDGSFRAAMAAAEHLTGLEKITGAQFIGSHVLFSSDALLENHASQQLVQNLAQDAQFTDERVSSVNSDSKSTTYVFYTEKFGIYGVAGMGYLMFAAVLVVAIIRFARAPVTNVKQAGEGMRESLMTVASASKALADNAGAYVPAPSQIPGMVDRAGYNVKYTVVTALDDIADGVIDLVSVDDAPSGDEEA